jgi:hypothetical protein
MDQTPTTSGPSTLWRVVAVIVVVLIAGVAAFVLLRDDDDSTVITDASTSVVETTSAPETAPDTTEPATTSTPTTDTSPTTAAPTTSPPDTSQPPLPDPTRDAIWPWVDTETRYVDPVEAATGFAVDVLGFTDPIVGEFLAGDARSGEVEVRASEPGPITTIVVRQLTDDDSWWILAAVSENITVDEPRAGTEVTSPLVVAGTAAAFEGTVDVELRVDGTDEPILSGFVTGSGGPEPGPFSETFEFSDPGSTGGALILWSRSPRDGSVVVASALRIFYP